MRSDDDLEALFAEARRAPSSVSPELMARVLADAAAAMPRPRLAGGPAAAGIGEPPGWWPLLGGWPAMAGLAAAALAGFWIGVAQPLPAVLFDSLAEAGHAVELFGLGDPLARWEP
ncbi:hypothetical protein [Rubellimicrobium sp. CFH 75288]|uniref:hypothetical protein n=1 Tax=Rubellimicrobium sp. CFH 75288 TaxID=2697034 RepID=UPI0014126F39|nr:hypothetical protein [Rubellimicrobium sp. CFH 75288]NAZ37202.1 hypothetical protein [Rubellimicrobium sp. CFH 75288]